MLSVEQWRQFEQLLFRVREYRDGEEMLVFTSRSMTDLTHQLVGALLRTRHEGAVLDAWAKQIDPFLARLHEAARQHNPTVELRGQTYRVVSERVAGEVRAWIDENCPRGVD
jgi:hypothetical protein